MRICLLTFFLFFVVSCRVKDKQPQKKEAPVSINGYTPFFNQIKEAKYFLKEGDLIVRSGNDIISQMIKSFNQKDKSYSHSGLIFFKDGEPMVFHILADDDNPGHTLTADSLEKFCHPRHNSAFAIYRYDMDSSEIQQLKTSVDNWYAQGVRFDSAFNLKTDDLMYCSEMIKKGLTKATNNRISIETRHPSKPEATLAATKLPMSAETIIKLDIVPIDNLYTNKHCHLVRRFDFNPQK